MNEEPVLEHSPLCQEISSVGKTVNIEIYRFVGENEWVLEVVDQFNNSTVWDESFATDSAAIAEVKKTILSNGIASLIGPEDGKSNEEWK